MIVREADFDDIAAWAELRAALWPSATIDEHQNELLAVLSSPGKKIVTFLAVDQNGRLCGFAEAALRYDCVNGCDTSPVAFLEGIYVRREARGRNVGRTLCSTVEAWGRKQGCSEFASDALLQNDESHLFHKAVGFEETERVVYFRKAL